MNKINFKYLLSLPLFMALTQSALAQDSAAANTAAQANNPLANTTAFNVQAYHIGEMSDIDDSASQLVFRYAKPFKLRSSNWLMRASMPINNFPVGPSLSNRTGPGDFNIFATYLMDTGDPATSFGFGPLVTLPTATPNELGNEQWQIGLANVYFNARSSVFQFGYLATYTTGIGDTNDRERVNLLAFQPFAFMQLGSGWYTGTAPIWTYDFGDNDYSVPIGARLGKVFKSGDVVFNIFAEPQFSVLDKGAGQPEFQIFLGVNMQY